MGSWATCVWRQIPLPQLRHSARVEGFSVARAGAAEVAAVRSAAQISRRKTRRFIAGWFPEFLDASRSWVKFRILRSGWTVGGGFVNRVCLIRIKITVAEIAGACEQYEGFAAARVIGVCGRVLNFVAGAFGGLDCGAHRVTERFH